LSAGVTVGRAKKVAESAATRRTLISDVITILRVPFSRNEPARGVREDCRKGDRALHETARVAPLRV
jgi:hypothetical protein